MKNSGRVFTAILLALALALTQAAFASAENADTVRAVFESLTAEDSYYSEIKAQNQEYMEGLTMEETLEGDRFTITASGNEEFQGSWTFIQEGDHLTLTIDEEDFNGSTVALSVMQAVGDTYGMNRALLNAYVAGLDAMGLENPWYRNELDETTMKMKVSIYDAGPYDMKELDQMVPDDELLNMYSFEPLDGEYASRAFNLGKISMIMNGNVDDFTILLREFGDLDQLAYDSLICIVSYMKPAGWEAFTAEYTGLADAEGAGYSVQLNPDEETVREIYPEPFEGYSSAVIRFGTQAPGGESAEEETSGMTDIQYVMYVGTNDKDTNEPVFPPEEALEKAKAILIRLFGGYTIQEAHGGWVSDGVEYQEYTMVIYLSDTNLDQVHAAADEMISTFRQSTILIQANPTKTEFYSPAE